MAKASGKTARVFFMAALVAAGMMAAKPVQAGFEFKAPPKPQAQSKNADSVPVAPAVPAGAVDMAKLPPDGDAAMRPLPDVPPLPTGQMPGMQTSVKIAPAPKPVEAAAAPSYAPVMTPPRPAPVSPPVAAAPLAPAYASVDGFGNDMPLALALRQIVPANFAYSFDKAVNPGQRVNWTGGRPWDAVLNDALAPHGLKATIAGSSVRIDPSSGPTPAVQAQAVMPPAAPPSMPSSFVGVKDNAGPSFLTYQRKPSGQKDWSGEGAASYPRHEPAKHDGMDQMPPVPPAMPLPVASPISMASPPLPVPVSGSAIRTEAPEAIFSESPVRAAMPTLPIPESSISRQEDTTYVWPANGNVPAPPPPSMMEPLPPPITLDRPAAVSRQADTLSSAKPVKADQPVLAAMPTPVPHDGMDVDAPATAAKPADVKPAPVTTASAKTAAAPVPVRLAAIPPASIEPAAGGQSWNAEKGQSLKLVLEDWAQKAGTELYWNSMDDYTLPQDIHVSSSFTDAVQQVLSLYQARDSRPVGRLHKEGGAANQLVIESYSAPAASTEKKAG